MREGIAVAGSILVDKIKEISAYPREGELTKILSTGIFTGGMVPNDGVDIKKIRPTIPVFAIGKVGADGEGRHVIDSLSSSGVDVSGIVLTKSEETSFTDVMSVTGGQRTFFSYPGASATFGYDSIDWERLNVKMLHLGYFLLLERVDGGDGFKILQEARRRGIKTSIDLVSENSERYQAVRPCLPHVDNLIVNEIEAGKLADIEPTAGNLVPIARKLKELGVAERVIVHTPDIGILFDGEELIALPSYDLPSGYVKGTTGAGDAFCSGALVGIYEERSNAEILEMATVSATCSLRAVDATGGVECYENMREFCKRFQRKKICL